MGNTVSRGIRGRKVTRKVQKSCGGTYSGGGIPVPSRKPPQPKVKQPKVKPLLALEWKPLESFDKLTYRSCEVLRDLKGVVIGIVYALVPLRQAKKNFPNTIFTLHPTGYQWLALVNNRFETGAAKTAARARAEVERQFKNLTIVNSKFSSFI